MYLIYNHLIHTHILVRNIEPHIDEAPAYALSLQYPVCTSRSLSLINDLINDCWCAAQPPNYRRRVKDPPNGLP